MKSRLALLKAVTIEEVDSKIEEEVDSREIEEAMETEIMMGLPEETSEIDLEAALIVENKATWSKIAQNPKNQENSIEKEDTKDALTKTEVKVIGDLGEVTEEDIKINQEI